MRQYINISICTRMLRPSPPGAYRDHHIFYRMHIDYRELCASSSSCTIVHMCVRGVRNGKLFTHTLCTPRGTHLRCKTVDWTVERDGTTSPTTLYDMIVHSALQHSSTACLSRRPLSVIRREMSRRIVDLQTYTNNVNFNTVVGSSRALFPSSAAADNNRTKT